MLPHEEVMQHQRIEKQVILTSEVIGRFLSWMAQVKGSVISRSEIRSQYRDSFLLKEGNKLG